MVGQSLSSLLLPLVRPMAVMRLKRAAAPLPATASKFGGMPYIPRGEAWPLCAGCRRRLSFICQADLRAAGLDRDLRVPFFQFFFCWKCHPWDGADPESRGRWLVRSFDRVSEASAASPAELGDGNGDAGLGKSAVEHAVAFEPGRSLPDWETIADVAPEVIDLAEDENEDAPWEAYDAAVEAIVGPPPAHDHSILGGWPAWIQGNATPDGYRQLAMIDSEGGIMWGDSGAAYLFASETDPLRFTLEIQCC